MKTIGVAYDVVCDRRRNRLVEILKDYGVRVQKSVFECRIGEGMVKDLCDEIGEVIDRSEDSVRVYGFCSQCYRDLQIMGQGERVKDMDVYVV